MPIYCFSNGAGETVEKYMSIGELEACRAVDGTYYIDGESFWRDLRAEVAGGPSSRDADLTSDALGFLPEHAAETQREDAQHSYTKPDYYERTSGGYVRPHWTGDAATARARRRAYCKERGLCKRDEFAS